jgi:hypothetical protein
LALGFSTQPIVGAGSFWDISPIVVGPWDLGPNTDVGTFYRYVPDLSIAQVTFLVGVTVGLMATLGLTARAGDRRVRRAAAALTVGALLFAGTAVGLAGTGRVDRQGMIAIPALHDAANDAPVRYTPVCSHNTVPVCFNPAFAGYLPAVTSALGPVLDQVAGLPGAPVRVSQVAATFAQGPANSVGLVSPGAVLSGTPPVLHLVLPDQGPVPEMTARQLALVVGASAGPSIVEDVVGGGPGATEAQQAVASALLAVGAVPALRQGPVPQGSPPPTPAVDLTAPVRAAARRFAGLAVGARHAWLAGHLAALKDGQITLAQLP